MPILYTQENEYHLSIQGNPALVVGDSDSDSLSEDYITNLTYANIGGQFHLTWSATNTYTYIILDGNLYSITTQNSIYLPVGQYYVELWSSDSNNEDWVNLYQYVPNNQFTFIWTPISGATSYNLYLGSTLLTNIVESGQSSYSFQIQKLSDTGISSTNDLTLKVVDDVGNESTAQTASFHIITMPPKVTNITVTQPGGANTIDFGWTDVSF